MSESYHYLEENGKTNPENHPVARRGRVVAAYCYGAVGMIREWILKDKSTPAETVIRMMFNSMPKSLQQIYFQKTVK